MALMASTPKLLPLSRNTVRPSHSSIDFSMVATTVVKGKYLNGRYLEMVKTITSTIYVIACFKTIGVHYQKLSRVSSVSQVNT